MNKDLKNKIYGIGSKIGLNTKDLNLIINDMDSTSKVSYSSGPPGYPGGRYGTVSTKDFEMRKPK